jgi:hypothetical protein
MHAAKVALSSSSFTSMTIPSGHHPTVPGMDLIQHLIAVLSNDVWKIPNVHSGDTVYSSFFSGITDVFSCSGIQTG